jgi:tRNA(Ile)-lysidine synthase
MPSSLNPDAIFAALDGLRARFGERFLIGLSGGGDSMALAHLCAAWSRRSGAQVHVLCIDHGFRPESAAEAQQAANWARALGLTTEVHTNDQPKPDTGLQEFARNLRLGAFAKAALDLGGATILLAHTRDDQAETIAFRLARQTGLDGLAGMAEVTFGLAQWQGQNFPIARPLLAVTREDLRHYLRSVRQDWIEDPSNHNLDFARVKVRQRLAALGQSARLVQIGALARGLRDTIEAHTDTLEQRVCENDSLNAAEFLMAEPALQTRLLQRRLQAAGAPDRPLDRDKLAHLLNQMAQPGFSGATLAGIKITQTKGTFAFAKAPARRKSAVIQQNE